MFRHITISAFLLAWMSLGSHAWAQKKEIIILEPDLMSIPERDFYIKDVVNDREEPYASLGTVYTGLFGREKQLVLLDGVEQGLESYLQKALPRMEGDVGVTMVVQELYVDESKGASKKGEMTLKVRFVHDALRNYTTQAAFEYSNANPTLTYEKILKKTIALVMETYAEEGPTLEK